MDWFRLRKLCAVPRSPEAQDICPVFLPGFSARVPHVGTIRAHRARQVKENAAKPVPSRLCPPAPCPGALLSPSPREPVPSFLPGCGLLLPREWPGGLVQLPPLPSWWGLEPSGREERRPVAAAEPAALRPGELGLRGGALMAGGVTPQLTAAPGPAHPPGALGVPQRQGRDGDDRRLGAAAFLSRCGWS